GVLAAGTLTITVKPPVNSPPAFTSGTSAAFAAGRPGQFLVTASGTPPPALSVSPPLPAGLTFVDNGNGTATLSGTPAAGTGGTYPLTLTADNTVPNAATQPFTLTVNQAPAFTSAAAITFTVGSGGAFTVAATGFPAPTLSVTGTLPTGVSFN